VKDMESRVNHWSGGESKALFAQIKVKAGL
jgi:hypothetical protein